MILSQALSSALKLDSGLESWFKTLPPHWKPISVTREATTEHSDSSLPAPFLRSANGTLTGEKHSNVWIATTCNFVRACRIYLQVLCIDAYSMVGPADSAEAQFAKAIIFEQVDQICATVAAALGCDLMNPESFSADVARSNARALGGYSLLWPLWSALQVEFLNSERRTWLDCWLAYISKARAIGCLHFT